MLRSTWRRTGSSHIRSNNSSNSNSNSHYTESKKTSEREKKIVFVLFPLTLMCNNTSSTKRIKQELKCLQLVCVCACMSACEHFDWRLIFIFMKSFHRSTAHINIGALCACNKCHTTRQLDLGSPHLHAHVQLITIDNFYRIVVIILYISIRSSFRFQQLSQLFESSSTTTTTCLAKRKRSHSFRRPPTLSIECTRGSIDQKVSLVVDFLAI